MHFSFIKLIHALFFAFLSLSMHTHLQASIKTKVIITAGADKLTRQHVGQILSRTISKANSMREGGNSLQSLKGICTASGYKKLQSLLLNTRFYATRPEYRLPLLVGLNQAWEVRGLKVFIRNEVSDTTFTQYLVFSITHDLKLSDIRFALESHHYRSIFSKGQTVEDSDNRMEIVRYLEDFRTAHNNKNIAYIEQQYSNLALIIVGRVIQTDSSSMSYLNAVDPNGRGIESESASAQNMVNNELGDQQIEFIRLSKQEYIRRLRAAFIRNETVHIIFQDVTIKRHPMHATIYGIHVRQYWESTTYSDAGYLFIMIDFSDKEKPVIHVRAWQRTKFADGSTVGLGDFYIN